MLIFLNKRGELGDDAAKRWILPLSFSQSGFLKVSFALSLILVTSTSEILAARLLSS